MWLAEWLAEKMDLRPGMRVLDLGCGRALSSIFLHREFGVQVWAADLWFSPAENVRRVRDAGAEGGVFPLRADAKALPFAESEPGATGLELLLSLAYKWAQDDGIPLHQALGVVTHRSVAVVGSALGPLAASAGRLVVGGVADICIFDPNAAWTVEASALRSQGHNTPFEGYELPGRVRATLVGGHLAYRA